MTGSSSTGLEVDGNLSPSIKLVAFVLQREGPLTFAELRERTDMADKTVRRAVSELEEQGAIRKDVRPQDTRRRICRYIPEAERDRTHG